MSMKIFKRIICVFILGVIMVGCDSTKDTSVKKEEKITLTDKEKQLDKDEIAKILVYKALVIEADKDVYKRQDGLSYYELGRQTGRMAKEILVDGKKPEDMPVETLANTTKVVNEKTMKNLKLNKELPVFEGAEFIEPVSYTHLDVYKRQVPVVLVNNRF